jgi:hypothetical protein
MPTLKKAERMSDINKTISEGLGWEKEVLSVSKSVCLVSVVHALSIKTWSKCGH